MASRRSAPSRRGRDGSASGFGVPRDRSQCPLASSNAERYHSLVIRSFADRDTERLWEREPVRRFPPDLRRVMLRKLGLVDAAVQLEDLRLPPGNRLEKLRGDRAGQHSIRVNDQWRICFRWADGNADDVAIVDYH